MTPTQYLLLKTLIDLSYSYGFNYFRISELSKETGIPEKEIYDNNTNTGALWEYGPHEGYGALWYQDGALAIGYDCREQLEREVKYARDTNTYD